MKLGFLHLVTSAFALCFSQPAVDEALLRNDAEERLLRQVTAGYGELNEFQSVAATGFFLAELDGRPPREAVVDLYYYLGEGGGEYYLAVYSLAEADRPRLLTLEPYLEEYMSGVLLEPADLDGDGRNELFVVGGTDGGAPSDLEVLSWSGDRFQDLVPGPDPGVSYLRVDLDGDGAQEIVALGLTFDEPQSATVKVLRRDGEGYYREAATSDLPELLTYTYREVLAAGRLARPAYDLPLLTRALREQGAVPEDLVSRQGDLESLYASFEGHGHDRSQIVAAMAWPGNSSARPLLEGILSAQDSDTWIAAEAATALAAVAGQGAMDYLLTLLEDRLHPSTTKIEERFVAGLVEALLRLGDRRGLELAMDAARDPAVPAGVREDLVFWVLGNHPTEAEAVLFELATGSPEPEIQRLASARLEQVDREATRLTPADLLVGLTHANEQVRASFALLAGNLGRQAMVRHLLEALATEEHPWPRRQILLALSDLAVEGRGDVYDLADELLERETDPDIRWRLQALRERNTPHVGAP